MSAAPNRRGERVLVLVLDEEPDVSALRRTLERAPDAHVRLVAPRHVGPLDWFATDEEDTNRAAEGRAGEGARALEPVADVEAAEAGELDPVLAVEDALNDSHADRIVVLGEADSALDAELHRFGLPVEHVDETPSDEPASVVHEAGRGIMSGRSRLTPYAAVAGAAVFILVVAAVVYVLAAIIL